MAGMPVPDELLTFFARAQAGRCTVAFDASSVKLIAANGKTKTLARPCTMPEVEAAAREISK